MSQVMFENKKIRLEHVETYINEEQNRRLIFKVDIKDFDTPVLNIEYDNDESVIVRTWIENDEIVSMPKGHVVYKIFSLIEYEVFEIIQFMIKHL